MKSTLILSENFIKKNKNIKYFKINNFFLNKDKNIYYLNPIVDNFSKKN